MRFATPHWLALLLTLPLIWWWLRRRRPTLGYSAVSLLQNSGMTLAFDPRMWGWALRSLALVCLIIALARPQSGRQITEVTSEGVDILLAIDTSGSMQALDFTWQGERENRLAVVKRVVTNFIEARPYDRIGLVVFGEEAFTQSPLTLDHQLLDEFVDAMEIGMAGEATAIGSAIAVSTQRLKELKAEEKILILLTDGQSNAGPLTPNQAAEAAAHYGIKIYTIGAGTQGKAPFEVEGFFGKRTIYREVDLDEPTLRQVAKVTGGRYFRATDTDELQKIYQVIDELEKTEVQVKNYDLYDELYRPWLAIALLCLLLERLLQLTRWRALP